MAAGASGVVEPEARHVVRGDGCCTFTRSTPTAACRCSASPTDTPRPTPPSRRRSPARRWEPTTTASSGSRRSGTSRTEYQDYLGTGQPLKTNDDLKAVAGRYLYRAEGDWFTGAQGNAANYQVLGDSPQDDLVLETLGIRGFESAALGVVVMHDSRNSEDMPTQGWYPNLNNLAYREALGGATSSDTYHADLRAFWRHGGGHVLAIRDSNWLTSDAPSAAQATVILRGYKLGEYLAPYMSSFEAEERLSLGARWGATLFAGAAGLYGKDGVTSATRDFYPTFGGGIHFVIKPAQRMLVNLEYAQGVEGNRGVFLKFGYGW